MNAFDQIRQRIIIERNKERADAAANGRPDPAFDITNIIKKIQDKSKKNSGSGNKPGITSPYKINGVNKSTIDPNSSFFNQLDSLTSNIDNRGYDILKTKVKRQGNVDREAMRNAIAKKLAAKGFKGGSGFTEALQTKSDISSYMDELNKIQDIDLEKLQQEQNIRNKIFDKKLDYTVNKQTNTEELKNKSYYDKGKSGTPLTDEELNNLKTNDPAAYYSYQAGKSGLSYEEYMFDKQSRDEAMKSALLRLDPNDPDFNTKMRDILKQYDIDVPLVTQKGDAGYGDTQEYKDLLEKTPEWVMETGTKNIRGDGVATIKNSPDKGTVIKYNGKLYEVIAKKQKYVWGPNSGGDYEYLVVKDLATGKETTIKPKGV